MKPTEGRVPRTMDGRAMVFLGEAQKVHVRYDGGWAPGSMVGWRHEDDGSCRIMVRFTVGGIERTAWVDLDDVRLPHRRPAHAAPPGWEDRGGTDARSTGPGRSRTETGDPAVEGGWFEELPATRSLPIAPAAPEAVHHVAGRPRHRRAAAHAGAATSAPAEPKPLTRPMPLAVAVPQQRTLGQRRANTDTVAALRLR